MAVAIDNGDPGRDRDVIRFTVFDPAGQAVSTVDGMLAAGNIRVSVQPTGGSR